ncbi:MAG: TetR family transcriptional regulator [Actinomycetota bacterium]|jgi:AcrR family transcriptional regulator
MEARTERRRRSDGQRMHAAILEVATRVASVEGIHGLTIGRLAEALGVSKSGLYAHFGSKEQLQLETIAAAEVIFEQEVMRPALQVPEGLRRLEALCEAYLSYVQRKVFPGGCFFASLLAETDARSGAIHDAALAGERAWQEGLAELIREAQRLGEIGTDVDVDRLAFELQAFLELGNFHFVLFGDQHHLDLARGAIASSLERAEAGRRRKRPPTSR